MISFELSCNCLGNVFALGLKVNKVIFVAKPYNKFYTEKLYKMIKEKWQVYLQS